MQYIFSLLLLFLSMQCSNQPDVDLPLPPELPVDTIPGIPTDTIEDVDTIPDIPTDTIEDVDTIVDETIPHIEIARSHIGIPPTDTINYWLAYVNLPPGNPWCAAAQATWLYQAGAKEPLIKTGLARNFVYKTPNRLRVSAGRVLAGVITMPKGSLVVYQRGETIFGHIGATTEDWTGQRGMYISGNTSPPDSGGSEFSGGGVWEKPAAIHPAAHLRITDFVYVNY